MEKITITTIIEAPVKKIWNFWTTPEHIIKWNNASDDWQTSHAENDLKVGGHFLSRMEAKDGSAGFDFKGVYEEVIPNEKIVYLMEDGRKVEVTFVETDGRTEVAETFDAEEENSLELQQQGWQAILTNFKKYVEN